MQEYMLLVRNDGDGKAGLSAAERQVFLNEVTAYIAKLMADGKLLRAQPLVQEGTIVSTSKGTWKDGPFNETKEIVVGYYHIRANDLAEAIAIAKGNPEFQYAASARIEVRPIKPMEPSISYVYPAGK